MLGKLFKHEFRRIGKMAGLLLAVIFGVTVIGSVYLVSPLFHSIIDASSGSGMMLTVVGGILALIGLLSYTLILIGLSFGFIIYLGFRFYRSMYSDEGYLTHTLPVKASQLIIVKTVTGGIWMLIMTLALYVMVGFLTTLGYAQMKGLSFFEVISNFRDLFNMFVEYLREGAGFDLSTSGVLLTCTTLISPFATVAILFGALTLGQYSWKNKGLMGILAYIGVRVAMTIFGGILGLGSTMLRASQGTDPRVMFQLANDRYLVSLLTQVIFAGILFLWSIHVVRDRLNME